jgi:GAF domain-containing protein
MMQKKGEPDAIPREHDKVESLELRLSAHGGFVDVLHELMRACDEPPPDSALMQLLERSLESVVEATDSEMGAFMVHEKDHQGLVFVLNHGDRTSAESKWSPVPKDQGIAHWVAQHNSAAVVNNVRADRRCGPNLDVGGMTSIHSVLAVPVINANEVLGVVEVINKRHGALYAKRDKKRLELMCHFDGKLLAELVRRQTQWHRQAKSA